MSTGNKDCQTCLHQQVCGFLHNFQKLQQLGQVDFNCNYYLNSVPVEEKAPEPDPTYKNMSVDEVSKLLDGDTDEVVQAEVGTCEICGAENTDVRRCCQCGKMVCGLCHEIAEELDPDTGDAVEKIYCKECSD